MNFGSDDLKKEIIEPVLAGEKFICLAISEAFAGSDVMGMKTTATKTEDGQHYIVNGTKVRINERGYDSREARKHVFRKANFRPFFVHSLSFVSQKWITNGMWADYFTTGLKTDDGFAVICIPRLEGVETRQIRTSYSTTAGTAYVTFDNVKVPARYVVGEDGLGIPVILSNFK